MKSVILGILVAACGSGLMQARQWTDSASGRSIEAEMLGLELGKAIVQMPNRARGALTVANLSPADQEWIKNWAVGKGPMELLPLPVWPDAVQQPEITVKQVAGGAGRDFLFQSPHYEFVCDAPVSVSVMNDFATVAEGTVRLLESLPIHWPRAEGKTFHARIVQNRKRYQQAGGPPGSSGVYMTGSLTGEGILLVPFDSLGIEQFAGHNTKGYSYTATVLIHEMVHQATSNMILLMPRWVAEGMAEYGANMTYRNGTFYLTERERLQALRRRLEFYENINKELIAKNPGSAMRLPASWVMHPSDLIKKPESAWMLGARKGNSQIEIHRMYLSSMFLMYYFMHFADNGEARRIRVYFDHLAEAAKTLPTGNLDGRVEATLDELRSSSLSFLIGGLSMPELDADFHRRFAALGFRIGE